MSSMNINRVVLTAHLTRDPELRALPTGTSICDLRIACNTRRKNSTTGEWEDRPNYLDVVVFGAQAESAARYLAKGRQVAIDGRLQWREWDTQDGVRRQNVQIIAETIQFLPSRENTTGPGDAGTETAEADISLSGVTGASDAQPAPVGGTELEPDTCS